MSGTKRGTILVIDDDADILDAIRDLLQREGYQVVPAVNGADALAALAAGPVDLILLDLLMPVMSGWEFLESSAGDGRTTPVIVMSAAPHDVEIGANVRVVLQKPVGRGSLLHHVARQLRTA